MSGQTKKRGATIPRLLRQAIIQDYLSGRKSSYMLSVEHGIDQKNINKMVNRYQRENPLTLEQLSIPQPMKRKKHNPSDDLTLRLENEELRRQLEAARLKLEGYQIMGDILDEEYGIDLLKKLEAKQSSNSKSDTQE
ncbi:hypothetical protein H7X66_09035 [Dysgonomonas sp. BGC7]|uniref:hypothetical protein n=2 Tax=Dysgonomonas sp. BGC7 TaxID=1658008 RepID=UPI000682221D|nr:hypothetical protein [Dysgonomonas sp. BGC7]MBD8388799.1 hypothetical protein [Dysgonomonas sp. BGC7]